MKTESRPLFVMFTQEEKIDLGAKCAKISEEIDKIESDKKRVNGLREDLSVELQRYQKGGEHREVKCSVHFNEPRSGRKTIIRQDTGEVLGDEPMTQPEMQLTMDDEPGFRERGYDSMEISDGADTVIARIPNANQA